MVGWDNPTISCLVQSWNTLFEPICLFPSLSDVKHCGLCSFSQCGFLQFRTVKLPTISEQKEERALLIPLANEHGHHNQHGHDKSLVGKYLAALMALLLLMYEGVTTATMELLHCIRIDDQLYLVNAGYIQCWTSWQKGLLVVLGLVLGPFPFFLILFRWKLRTNDNSYTYEMMHVLEGPYKQKRAWWETISLFGDWF